MQSERNPDFSRDDQWKIPLKQMKKFAIAKKLKMTSYFLESGTVIPVTVLQASPLVITQIKTAIKDKYNAVQVGYGSKKAANKPLSGHIKGNKPFAMLKEFRTEGNEEHQVGQNISAEFEIGQTKKIAGLSGSIGQRFPQHVRKGLRMAGRMGGVGVTVKNLQVIDFDAKRNLIAVKGAVPGHRNGIVQVVSAGVSKPLEYIAPSTDKKKK